MRRGSWGCSSGPPRLRSSTRRTRSSLGWSSWWSHHPGRCQHHRSPGWKRLCQKYDITIFYTYIVLLRSVLFCIVPYHTVSYHTLLFCTVVYLLYRAVEYCTVPFCFIPYHTVSYHTVPFHALPSRTVPYYTLLFCTVPYRTVLYHTVPFRTVPDCIQCYHAEPYLTVPYHTYCFILSWNLSVICVKNLRHAFPRLKPMVDRSRHMKSRLAIASSSGEQLQDRAAPSPSPTRAHLLQNLSRAVPRARLKCTSWKCLGTLSSLKVHIDIKSIFWLNLAKVAGQIGHLALLPPLWPSPRWTEFTCLSQWYLRSKPCATIHFNNRAKYH